MTVDDVVKLILAITFAISLLGVSIQTMRLIGKLTNILGETEEGVKNAVKLTTMATEDYTSIRAQIIELLSLLQGIKTNVIDPVMKILGMVNSVGSMFNGSKDKGFDMPDKLSE